MSEVENTVTLQAPVVAYDGEITQITLRKPTGQDGRLVGALPYVVGQDEQVRLELGICAKYISRLGNVPISTVDKLHAFDLNALAWMVARFFISGDSPDTTNS